MNRLIMNSKIWIGLMLFAIFSIDKVDAQETNSEDISKTKRDSIIYPRHKATIDLFAPIGREITFHYEYLLPKQRVAIRVPVGFIFAEDDSRFSMMSGTKDDYDYRGREYPYQSVDFKELMGFRTGMEFLVFLNKPKRFRPYLAPGMFTVLFLGKYERVLVDKLDETYTRTSLGNTTKVGGSIGANLNFGVQLMTKKKFSLGIETGVGMGAKVGSSFDYDWLFYKKISFLFGFHFDGKKRKQTE